jgi:hypothetical protein
MMTVKSIIVICVLLNIAACGHDSPPEPNKPRESAQAVMNRIEIEILGAEFRQAIADYANKKGQFRGLALISKRDNLVLVSIDFGDHTETVLASSYIGDSSYWRVEDLGKSNRELLTLLRPTAEKDTSDPPD